MSSLSSHTTSATGTRSGASCDEPPTVYARIFAATVAVEGLPAALAHRLSLLLKPFLAPGDERAVTHRLRIQYDDGSGCWYLYEGADRCSNATSDDEMLGLAEWFVMHWGVSSCTDPLLLHGAALFRAGATLLLLGESGAGKTTLTLGLLARGWLPYGDDVTLVDPQTLHVRPFPRYFHVDAATRDLVAGSHVLRRVGAVAGYAAPRRWTSASSRPTTIVTVERDSDRPAAIEPISRAEAAGALLHAAMETPMPRGEVAHLAACIAANVSGCYRLNNGELHTALDLLEAAANPRWDIPGSAHAHATPSR